MATHHDAIRLVRAALRLLDYEPGGRAWQLCRDGIMRDLEVTFPDAWRAVVRSQAATV